ncbi:MAG: epoxyqueuosine reductase [Ruminococcaceae bacterium]|nr:epoxyqueuosine reductase [Oscillospiraceae bacterium]
MELDDFFELHNIELYAAVDYKNIKVIDPQKLQRCVDFSPRSVLVMAVPYYIGEIKNRNISLYAVANDYHLYFKDLFSELISFLEDRYPNNKFAAFADSSPIDERHAAAIAGIGIIGKNGLLITEKYGSYVFLGEVISDLEPSAFFGKIPELFPIRHCRGCNLCKSSCPMEKHGVCLSELSQKKGELTYDEALIIKENGSAWGCDLCQTPCPHNKNVKISPIDFFHKDIIGCLDRQTVENMPSVEFKKRAWAWRGKKTILRNIDFFNNEAYNNTYYNKKVDNNDK